MLSCTGKCCAGFRQGQVTAASNSPQRPTTSKRPTNRSWQRSNPSQCSYIKNVQIQENGLFWGPKKVPYNCPICLKIWLWHLEHTERLLAKFQTRRCSTFSTAEGQKNTWFRAIDLGAGKHLRPDRDKTNLSPGLLPQKIPYATLLWRLACSTLIHKVFC